MRVCAATFCLLAESASRVLLALRAWRLAALGAGVPPARGERAIWHRDIPQSVFYAASARHWRAAAVRHVAQGEKGAPGLPARARGARFCRVTCARLNRLGQRSLRKARRVCQACPPGPALRVPAKQHARGRPVPALIPCTRWVTCAQRGMPGAHLSHLPISGSMAGRTGPVLLVPAE